MHSLPERCGGIKPGAYRRCTRCVMDSSVADLTFDEHGVCSYCRQYETYGRFSPSTQKKYTAAAREQLLAEVRASRRGKYDCIIGLSGGADSSYVAYLTVQLGLKPLAIHLDNGWNSELAVKNIESIVKNLNLDLITYVIDWEEFRDVQRSFFKAGVVDIEMITDHAINVVLFRIAKQFDLRYFLAGTNLATEAMMPPDWFFENKLDPFHLHKIYRRFGSGRPLASFPIFGTWEYLQCRYFPKIKMISFLNYFEYDKTKAVQMLQDKIGYAPYPIKHYESVFTRFYQGHILPEKFCIDKRLPFLSTMIMTGQTTRDAALEELKKETYDAAQLRQDRRFVIKKLMFDEREFEAYMQATPVNHKRYASISAIESKLRFIKRRVLRIKTPMFRVG